MKFSSVLIPAVLAAALFSAESFANVTTFSSRSLFNAEGTIFQNSDFSSFSGIGGFSFPGNPFTRGDVTYRSLDNLVVDSCAYSIACQTPVITNNYWTPIVGSISTAGHQYNLFGFDGAVTEGTLDITVTTNVRSYSYNRLAAGNGSPDFTFFGFEASAGEYFTGFRIDSLGSGMLPGMTNVSLGEAGGASAVPEPSGFALAGLALVALCAARPRRRER